MQSDLLHSFCTDVKRKYTFASLGRKLHFLILNQYISLSNIYLAMFCELIFFQLKLHTIVFIQFFFWLDLVQTNLILVEANLTKAIFTPKTIFGPKSISNRLLISISLPCSWLFHLMASASVNAPQQEMHGPLCPKWTG